MDFFGGRVQTLQRQTFCI